MTDDERNLLLICSSVLSVRLLSDIAIMESAGKNVDFYRKVYAQVETLSLRIEANNKPTKDVDIC